MARARSALKGFLRDVEAARLERGRNTLAAWLRTHHDELLAELDGRPIEWELYLVVLAKRGLKDAGGNTPTKATAAKTWHRVRAAIAAQRAKRARAGPPLAQGEIAPGVRSVDPGPVSATPSPPPRMRLDIRPARALVEMPPGPTAAVAARQDASARADAEEQIRRALDAMEVGRTPMPQVVR